MGLVVVFLTLNVALIAAYLRHRWRAARLRPAPISPKRLTDEELRGFAIRQVLLVLIAAYAYYHGDWNPASVGFHGREPWLYSILAGELAFLGISLCFALALYLIGKYRAMREKGMRVNLRIWPRGRTQKWIAGLFLMVSNPSTEEFVMRGVLIHQWGLMLGSPVVPILVGFVLNGALHWYQGWRMQLWHALYFATAVALLYSPFGLAAAITAHVFGDVIPIVKLRRQLKVVRRARHAALRAQSA